MKLKLNRWVFWGCFGVTGTFMATVCTEQAAGQSEAPAVSVAANNGTLADKYFFEAKAKAADHRWDEALQLLEKAWDIKPSHDIAGNLGQIALKFGQYKKAATFLDRCLRLFPPTGNSEQRTQISNLFQTARVHVAAVRLHVTAAQGELVMDRVTLLGPSKEQSEPVFVDPGTHTVLVRQNDRILAEQSFMAVAGATQDINLVPNGDAYRDSAARPGAQVSAPKLPEKTATGSLNSELSRRSSLPIVAGATVSAVGFISAVLFLNAAHNSVQTAQGIAARIPTGCLTSGHESECRSLYDANARADTRYDWGYAMLGVGGVALVATVTYALWPINSESRAAKITGRKLWPVNFDIGKGQGMISWVKRF